MKCLVLSFLMGYNGRTYKRGEYVEVADDASVKRLVRERCVKTIPSEVVKTVEVEEVKVEEVPSIPTSFLNDGEKTEEVKDSTKTGMSMVRKQVNRRGGGNKK